MSRAVSSVIMVYANGSYLKSMYERYYRRRKRLTPLLCAEKLFAYIRHNTYSQWRQETEWRIYFMCEFFAEASSRRKTSGKCARMFWKVIFFFRATVGNPLWDFFPYNFRVCALFTNSPCLHDLFILWIDVWMVAGDIFKFEKTATLKSFSITTVSKVVRETRNAILRSAIEFWS